MKQLTGVLAILMVVLYSSCYTGRSGTSPTYNPKFLYFNQFPSNWSSTDGDINFNTTLNVPELTSNDVDTKGVLIDISFDNGNTYQQLPSIKGQVYYSCEYTTNTIKINAHNYIATAIIPNPGVTRVKVILLPAN